MGWWGARTCLTSYKPDVLWCVCVVCICGVVWYVYVLWYGVCMWYGMMYVCGVVCMCVCGVVWCVECVCGMNIF